MSDEAPAALPGDGLREGIIAALRDDLGEGLIETHLVPQTDLWVRVSAESWSLAGEALKAHGFEFFGFLSAIDWMPSPYGKSEEDPMAAAADSAAAAAVSAAPVASEDAAAAAEGSASDEADAARGGSEADDEPAIENGSAADDEPAIENGSASDAAPAFDWGYTGGESRFQVFARVVDVVRHVGVTVKADVPDSMTMPTWIPHYAGANWHERETHEMFGINFDGHPDLRNLYLPTDFEGYPLRKDFPLLARLVKPWPGFVDVEPMPELDDSDGDAS